MREHLSANRISISVHVFWDLICVFVFLDLVKWSCMHKIGPISMCIQMSDIEIVTNKSRITAVFFVAAQKQNRKLSSSFIQYISFGVSVVGFFLFHFHFVGSFVALAYALHAY